MHWKEEGFANHSYNINTGKFMQLAYTTTAKNITSSISATVLFTVSLTLTQSALAASKRQNTYLCEAELYR